MFCAVVGMRQFTVSEKVAVCRAEPPVAVTVTVEVTGGGSITMGEAAPQPLSTLNPATLTARSRSICNLRRLLQAKQQSATASAEPGNSGLGLRWKAAVVAEVLTVNVV